jgi:hypothetical protein
VTTMLPARFLPLGMTAPLLLLSLMCGVLSMTASGQQHHASKLFYQLNTSHGLSDNYIRSMTVDNRGILWVGTGEGLNSFNGKTVTKYFAKQYPALRYDYISQLECDGNFGMRACTRTPYSYLLSAWYLCLPLVWCLLLPKGISDLQKPTAGMGQLIRLICVILNLSTSVDWRQRAIHGYSNAGPLVTRVVW